MKICLIILILISYPVFTQTEFSGNAEVSITGLIPEDNYDSPVNPDNQYGIKDFSMSPLIVFDISNYDDLTNFEAKFTLSSYPIGSLIQFMGQSADPQTQSLLGEYINQTGETINTFELERVFLDIMLTESLTFSVGRKPFLIGYGYGWNPTDNINPLKNPEDPNAELKGVDSLTLNLDMGISTVRSILILNREILTQGTNYDHLAIASDINFYLDGLDLMFTGYYNFSEERSSKVNSAGAGFKVDILGIGFYGEGIVLDGSRNLIPNKLGIPEYKEDPVFNILGGLEYVFETDTSAVLEYYYNGEGYDKDEREMYETYLKNAPFPLHRSSNYTEQYLLLNLSQSLYDLNSTAGLTTIFSIDSQNLTLSPSYEISFSENTNIKFSYTGILNFNSDDFTERELSPIKNLFNMTITYAF